MTLSAAWAPWRPQSSHASETPQEITPTVFMVAKNPRSVCDRSVELRTGLRNLFLELVRPGASLRLLVEDNLERDGAMRLQDTARLSIVSNSVKLVHLNE